MVFRQNETFFLQSEIEIFTDNAVCVTLEKYKFMNACETRFIAYLSQFRFKVRYIPDSINRIANALSLLPEDVKTSELLEFKPQTTLKTRNLFSL